MLDALAGLLAAGMLVVGVLLVPAQFLAPPLLSMAGWGGHRRMDRGSARS